MPMHFMQNSEHDIILVWTLVGQIYGHVKLEVNGWTVIHHGASIPVHLNSAESMAKHEEYWNTCSCGNMHAYVSVQHYWIIH